MPKWESWGTLYDKIAAAAHLGRFEGLSRERLEHTGPDGKPLNRCIEIEFVEPNRAQPEGTLNDLGEVAK
jgi:hypothetical protein